MNNITNSTNSTNSLILIKKKIESLNNTRQIEILKIFCNS